MSECWESELAVLAAAAVVVWMAWPWASVAAACLLVTALVVARAVVVAARRVTALVVVCSVPAPCSAAAVV